MGRTEDIQKQVLAIRKQIESLGSGLEQLREEVNRLEEITIGEEDVPEKGPKLKRGMFVTLSRKEKRKPTHSFHFTMGFRAEYVRDERDKYVGVDFDDEKHRVYFGFHRDNPKGDMWAVTRRRAKVTPRKRYGWLEELFNRNLDDRQLPIETNEEQSRFSKHPYYISVK
jgi:hypothetical protein